MKKTLIPWTDYSINPVKGLCPVACSYCYARRMYKRFKWNPEIEWCPRVFRGLDKLKPGSRVFVGSTIELFGEWVKDIWLKLIFEEVILHPDLTFIFLTKQPQNLIKWSPFPDNCWVGVSAVDYCHATDACGWMDNIQAKVKFLSIEPLLSWNEAINTSAAKNWFSDLGWLIIGSQTKPVKHPPREWVDEIITAADKANIPVFVKEPMASYYNIQRQEFPRR